MVFLHFQSTVNKSQLYSVTTAWLLSRGEEHSAVLKCVKPLQVSACPLVLSQYRVILFMLLTLAMSSIFSPQTACQTGQKQGQGLLSALAPVRLACTGLYLCGNCETTAPVSRGLCLGPQPELFSGFASNLTLTRSQKQLPKLKPGDVHISKSLTALGKLVLCVPWAQKGGSRLVGWGHSICPAQT